MTNTGQQGWINPSTNSLTPIIMSLSVTNSISGTETIVSILGSGFKPFSIITFGPYNPIQIFISSGQINFYVPFSTLPGTYPVQVSNASTNSNTVNFYIDPPIGFWKIDANGQTISNTNVYSPSIDSVKINGSLNVIGQVKSNGSALTSDYRIKSVIEALNNNNNNSLYSVDNLKPIKYFNKQSGATEIGFIAHELQEEFPYLVTGEKDGKEMQTVNYIGLIGILVKEIQELKTEIKELKNLK
jgi:hypothetical protein